MKILSIFDRTEFWGDQLEMMIMLVTVVVVIVRAKNNKDIETTKH